MNIDLSNEEAELLIAILTHAEKEAYQVPMNEPIIRAVADLRSFRSRLLIMFMKTIAAKGVEVKP